MIDILFLIFGIIWKLNLKLLSINFLFLFLLLSEITVCVTWLVLMLWGDELSNEIILAFAFISFKIFISFSFKLIFLFIFFNFGFIDEEEEEYINFLLLFNFILFELLSIL